MPEAWLQHLRKIIPLILSSSYCLLSCFIKEATSPQRDLGLPKVTQLVSGRGRIQTQMRTHTDLESKCLLQRNAISQLGYYPQCPLQLDGDS